MCHPISVYECLHQDAMPLPIRAHQFSTKPSVLQTTAFRTHVKVLDTRQTFLNLCQGNHYQFDQQRRAKHSSMMVSCTPCDDELPTLGFPRAVPSLGEDGWEKYRNDSLFSSPTISPLYNAVSIVSISNFKSNFLPRARARAPLACRNSSRCCTTCATRTFRSSFRRAHSA